MIDPGRFEQRTIKIHPIFSSYTITLFTILITYLLSKGISAKGKFIIWGIVILLISPPLTNAIGYSYAFYGGSGFAAIGAWMIYFPIIILIGITLLLVGFFKKSARAQ